ncbi:MAG: hypothetical protein SFX72_20155 [Isosphaeraceae bacterium]|nr:hypothetical protein [Isosphaeraceae bacterium]
MIILRSLRSILGFVVASAAWLPPLALGLGLFLDLAPNGRLRFSIFPAGVVLFDPATWEAAAHSLGLGVAVCLGAVLLGLPAGRVLLDLPGWAGVFARTGAALGFAGGPFLCALGLRMGLEIAGVDRFAEVISGALVPLGWSSDEAIVWSIVWAAHCLPATSLIAWAAADARTRIDPAWIESARALGASRTRVERDLIRPNIRPAVSRACAGIFCWVVLDPGPPLVAGLSRTLADEAFRALMRPGGATRAVVLTAVGLAMGIVARTLLSWWAGDDALAGSARRPPERAGFSRRLLALFLGSAWLAIAAAPILGLTGRLVARFDSESLTDMMSLIYYDLLDRSFLETLIFSGVLAAVAALSTAAIAAAAGWNQPAVGLADRAVRRLLELLARIPAPAIGVGTAVVVAAASEMPGLRQSAAIVGLWWGVIAWRLPGGIREEELGRDRDRADLVSTTLAFGGSRRAADRAARRGRRRLGRLAADGLRTAAALSPAVFLVNASDLSPLGPAILELFDTPAKACAAGAIGYAIGLTARACAGSEDPGPGRSRFPSP